MRGMGEELNAYDGMLQLQRKVLDKRRLQDTRSCHHRCRAPLCLNYIGDTLASL